MDDNMTRTGPTVWQLIVFLSEQAAIALGMLAVDCELERSEQNQQLGNLRMN
jgi:hypothetical protein